MGNFEPTNETLERIQLAAAAPQFGPIVMECWHKLKKSGYNSGTADSLLGISLDLAEEEIRVMTYRARNGVW